MEGNSDHNTAMELVGIGGSLASVRRQHAALLALMAILRKGTDYGNIPGCGDKPTLFKPGAEKVLNRFGITVGIKELDDLSTADYYRYRLTLVGKLRGEIEVGEGIGEASGAEEKYYWRRANDNEWDHCPAEARRIKYGIGKRGPYEIKQVRTNPADFANTVLKIAKKRALVDLALTATAASDFYTQDVEDLPEELRQDLEAERTATATTTRVQGFRRQINSDGAGTVDVDATVMATQEERKSIWFGFCESNEWDPEQLPEGAMAAFRAWVAQHAGDEAAKDSKSWTSDTVELLRGQLLIDMSGGQPPPDPADDDEIPF